MFQSRQHKNVLHRAFSTLTVIYHVTVRSARGGRGNAIIGLLTNIVSALVMFAVFYIMFAVLGLRGSAIRGDFVVFLLSGIFMFQTHIKAMKAVIGAEGPTSPMMQHAPMNTLVSIISEALGALYLQVLAAAVILFVYYVAFQPFTIQYPPGVLAMLILSWFTGCAIGVIFLALKPWFPNFVGIGSQFYMRANMIASGKMFVANSLPGTMLAMFDWNPLFHAIDQARGFAFLNYNPRYSSWEYALIVGIVLLMIGLMGEYFTRKHASRSRGARG